MRNSIMKTIEVAAAVIVDSFENTTEVFATERGYGEFKGQWEFPGGKIEVGETPQQALIREIQEELTVKIKVGKLIDTIEYDYPKFHLNMKCFLCVIVDGDIIEIDIPARTINVRLTDEELAARPMTPVTRDRYVPKSLKAYASMVSSADKGAVRIID